jgi:CheY-like chemotaxis protein
VWGTGPLGTADALGEVRFMAHMQQRSRPRVLVVDDEELVRKALTLSLQAECEVAEAASGSEALARFGADDPFDVILCDLLMPGMTGVDFYRELLHRGSQAARTVVFMTGGTPPAVRAFLAGVGNLCLEKPVDANELRRVVRLFARTESPGEAS